MRLFNRKKKVNEPKEKLDFEIPILPHVCVWKDMPWYMETWYSSSDKQASYKIVEPYICILCGERKNKVLEQTEWTHITVNEREKIYSDIREQYKEYLKPRAVVEDMINNILLVKDPEHLESVELLKGTPHRRCGTSAEMKRIDETENDIGELFIPEENNK